MGGARCGVNADLGGQKCGVKPEVEKAGLEENPELGEVRCGVNSDVGWRQVWGAPGEGKEQMGGEPRPG